MSDEYYNDIRGRAADIELQAANTGLEAEQIRVRRESEALARERTAAAMVHGTESATTAERPAAAPAKPWPRDLAMWANVGSLWVLVIAALGSIMATRPDAAAVEVADVHTHAAAPAAGPGEPIIEIAMDPTCPWCRQQHAETAALRAAGWTVEYLPYPRAGAASDAGRALAAAWCEGAAAVDALMLSGDVATYAEPCAAGLAWVRDGRADAQARGVDATPTLFVRGAMSAGYRTAAAIGAP